MTLNCPNQGPVEACECRGARIRFRAIPQPLTTCTTSAMRERERERDNILTLALDDFGGGGCGSLETERERNANAVVTCMHHANIFKAKAERLNLFGQFCGGRETVR